MNAIFSFFSLAILPLSLVGAVLFYEKIRRGLRQKLARMEKELSQAQTNLRALQREQRETRRFRSAFDTADLSRQLRETQMTGRKIAQVESPERYRYASSLIACGVEAEQLAEGLSLSRQEAEQLVALANLARKGDKNNGLKKTAGMPICH
jgi:ABC-type multidrug transport system fused ATPase/permease subunit